MVNFDFKKLDKDKVYANGKALKLVDFITNHIGFLPNLCECILGNTKLNCLDVNDRDGENIFSQYIDNLEFDDENNDNYVNEFEKVFREAYNVSDCNKEYERYKDEFDENIDRNKDKQLMTFEQFAEEQLGYIRGRVLEILLENFIRERYKPSRQRLDNYYLKFNTGCRIKLNGKELVTEDRKTVDVAGWDGTMGEFYEAKVNPENFDEVVLKLLTFIKDELEKERINAIVGCISMKNKETMILGIEEVIKQNKIKYNNNIQIYGRNELLNLLNNRPEIVPAA